MSEPKAPEPKSVGDTLAAISIVVSVCFAILTGVLAYLSVRRTRKQFSLKTRSVLMVYMDVDTTAKAGMPMLRLRLSSAGGPARVSDLYLCKSEWTRNPELAMIAYDPITNQVVKRGRKVSRCGCRTRCCTWQEQPSIDFSVFEQYPMPVSNLQGRAMLADVETPVPIGISESISLADVRSFDSCSANVLRVTRSGLLISPNDLGAISITPPPPLRKAKAKRSKAKDVSSPSQSRIDPRPSEPIAAVAGALAMAPTAVADPAAAIAQEFQLFFQWESHLKNTVLAGSDAIILAMGVSTNYDKETFDAERCYTVFKEHLNWWKTKSLVVKYQSMVSDDWYIAEVFRFRDEYDVILQRIRAAFEAMKA